MRDEIARQRRPEYYEADTAEIGQLRAELDEHRGTLPSLAMRGVGSYQLYLVGPKK